MLLACAYVEHQADQLIATATRMLEQHQRRVATGAMTSLNELDVQRLQNYIVALYGVVNQPGFPYEITWPDVPACLKQHIIT